LIVPAAPAVIAVGAKVIASTVDARSMRRHRSNYVKTPKGAGNIPIGKSTKFNVALQRPNQNIKEAENQGEQAQSEVNRIVGRPMTLSKHGTFLPSTGQLHQMFGGSEED
jgi:hypothetical protein